MEYTIASHLLLAELSERGALTESEKEKA